MNIRLAKEAELPKLMKIFDIAREYQRNHGNPTQWPVGYPDRSVVLNDIQNDFCYIIENEGPIVGTFTMIPGDEPTYRIIEDGKWISDEPYCTIHRVASDGTAHGIGKAMMDFCINKCRHIRIDTHKDNLIMQHVIEKSGFRYCGIIHIEDGSPRVAYELI